KPTTQHPPTQLQRLNFKKQKGTFQSGKKKRKKRKKRKKEKDVSRLSEDEETSLLHGVRLNEQRRVRGGKKE
ncbi:hypothetical protein ACOSB0_00305, partial [Candidatus Phytoplasma citri]